MSDKSEQDSNQLFENQLCFPLYSAANAMVRAYRPLLKRLDLTYLQYMVLMLLWQHKKMNVKALGQQLQLDSGTLTPLLKRLENKELVSRHRCDQDERVRLIKITPKGQALQKQAEDIPQQLMCKSGLSVQQGSDLKQLCTHLLTTLA